MGLFFGTEEVIINHLVNYTYKGRFIPNRIVSWSSSSRLDVWFGRSSRDHEKVKSKKNESEEEKNRKLLHLRIYWSFQVNFQTAQASLFFSAFYFWPLTLRTVTFFYDDLDFEKGHSSTSEREGFQWLHLKIFVYQLGVLNYIFLKQFRHI